MRRFAIGWFLGLSLASATVFAAGVLTPDTPTYDFGTLLEGQVVNHTFVLTNAGSAAVTVTKIETSCPCTTASVEPSTIQAGGTARLAVRFGSYGFRGRVSKGIYVSYSIRGSAGTARLDLTIYATVVEKEPHLLATGDLDLGFCLLIDLRSASTYAGRHLLGALSVPYDQLSSWIGRLPRGVFTVVYDQSETVAPAAARALRTAGYPDVQYLKGGLDAWTKAYPNRFLVTGASLGERFLLPSVGGGPGFALALNGVEPKKLKQDYLVLVDLRSAEAYATAHFAGAANVASGQLATWAAGLPKDTQIVLYDEDGTVAIPQALVLRGAGYSNAQALFGGLAEWKATFGDRLLVAAVAP